MFKRSGFSIAMGNASDQVKAEASAVTDSYDSPPELIEHVLPLWDIVMVMTANPDFGGQALLPEMLLKVRQCETCAPSVGSHQ